MTTCRACNTDFAGMAAFDLHRTGEFAGSSGGRGSRRCLTMEEMKAKTKKDGTPVFEVVDGEVTTFKTEEDMAKLHAMWAKKKPKET